MFKTSCLNIVIMKRVLHIYLSKIISIFKKEDFVIDKRIPLSYILSILWSRFLMAIRGVFLFRSFRKISFVGSNSIIKCTSLIKTGSNLSVGRDVYIDALSTDGIKFGRNVSIGKSTTIECSGSIKDIGKGLIVGDNVGMGTHGFWGCAGGVKVGSDTIFGNFVSLHSENHNYQDLEIPIRMQGVNRSGIIIGQNCWIGSKATILDGVIIGDGCIVAAGSVMLKGEYKENCIYGGVPARFLKNR